MATYRAPGVYVEEQPSAVKPIAGVGTSTAGFIGIFPDRVGIPKPNPNYDPTVAADSEEPGGGEQPPGEGEVDATEAAMSLAEESGIDLFAVEGSGEGGRILVSDVEAAIEAGIGMGGERDEQAPPQKPFILEEFESPPAAKVALITNFTEFQREFGDFSTHPGHRMLAHAVYGFFDNGGTRCFVARGARDTDIRTILTKFKAIDEIALVAAPGLSDESVHSALVSHCEQMGDRFAILDGPEEMEDEDGMLDMSLLDPSRRDSVVPDDSDYAAFYVPYLRVTDPATKLRFPKSDGRQYIPPSGHVAGIYARVDTERGVHKAPANETVRNALGLKYYISKTQQEGLNPHGINCIRDINGAHRVWGARTIGGDRNTEWKYINVRRLFLFLRESIEEGTQWVVFEPNTPALWGKIRRNVSAFLSLVWRDGALFGLTPQEAFYVKCDEETNPPEVREQGQVVTEIGVAVARPAEFVIFRIQQKAGGGGA